MPVRLRSLETMWTDVNAVLTEWRESIERALSFSWGPGFYVHDGPHGKTVHYDPEPPVRYARTTTGGIGARSGSTLGQGTIVIEDRSGTTVSDGTTELCFSNFNVAIPHPTNLTVGWDGSAYALVGADCPTS
jgi:hypothetical protein